MVYPGPLVAGRRYGPSSEWSLGFGLAGINRGIGIFQGAKKKSAPWKQTGFPRIFQSMESMAGIHKSVHGIYDIYGWMAGWLDGMVYHWLPPTRFWLYRLPESSKCCGDEVLRSGHFPHGV